MFVTAHAGHLALELLQFAPLIAVAGVVVWRTWQQRELRTGTQEPSPHAFAESRSTRARARE